MWGFALALSGATAAAQEADNSVDPDASPPQSSTAPPDLPAEEPAAPRLTTEAFDADELDPDAVAAGEAALELVARLEVEIVLEDLVNQELYLESVPVAQHLVELTEAELGESMELGVALSNLAILQRRAGIHDESERNFLLAVDMIRAVDGAFSDAIINPLIGLGINYHDRGDYLEAETIFEEARTISRRAYGLMNEQQIDILDHLSNTMVSMERYGEADRLQLTALQLRERIYGSDTIDILPALYKYASWMRSSYRFQEERDLYARALDILRELDDPSSIEMVTPLRHMGNSFRIQKYPDGRGISALRRALEVAEAQPEPDALMIAEILVDIGDWNVAFSKVGPSGEEYRQAWQLLGSVENGVELREQWFDAPRYVLRENPSNRGIVSPNEPDVLPGHVLISFDVDDQGRTVNVTVIESVPPGLKDDSTARAINRSRFRPRMVDGEIVWARGMARNFTFHYRPSD